MDPRQLHQLWDKALADIEQSHSEIDSPSADCEQEFRDILAVLRARYFQQPPTTTALLVSGGIHCDGRGDFSELLWTLDVWNTGEVKFWRRGREAIEASRARMQ